MRCEMSLAPVCFIVLLIAVPTANAGPVDDCTPLHPNPDLAIEACTKVINTSPFDAVAHTNRASNELIKGNFDRAVADFSEAIRLAPKNAVAYKGRAIAYISTGQHDLAIADLREASNLTSEDAMILSLRGLAYSRKGDYDRAIADFNAAIKLNPNSAFTHTERGTAYARKGEFDRAMADHDVAVKLGPDAVAFIRRGQTWEAKGNRARATEDYSKALTLPAKTQWERDEQAEAWRRLAALQAAHLQPIAHGRRVALVIGNARYKVGPLQNPGNDATAVAEALDRDLRFDKVMVRRDLPLEGFRVALRDFSREVAGADVGVVYFAGHGTEIGGRNYLIPVDASLAKTSDLDLETIALDAVLSQLDGARKLRLVILDACRNNIFPLAGAKRDAGRGLGRIEPDDNTLVVYAAKHGTTADDGVGRRHSPFTEALLKHITKTGVEVRQLFGYVRDDVMVLTGRAQQPYIYGTLGGPPLYLGRPP